MGGGGGIGCRHRFELILVAVMAENGTNGVDFQKLRVPAQLVVQIVILLVVAVASSATTLVIWQGSISHRIDVLESAQIRINSSHYAFRYPDAWTMLLAAERLNPGWVAPNIYALPSSAGDPPLFPQVARSLKTDRENYTRP